MHYVYFKCMSMSQKQIKVIWCYCWCKASIAPTKLPNMKSRCNELTRSGNGNVTFCEVPEIIYYNYVWRMVSCTKRVPRDPSIPGLMAVRCNAWICHRPKGQSWVGHTGSVLQKPRKIRFLGKMAPFQRNFEILFQKFSWPHRFAFYVHSNFMVITTG